MKLGVAVLAIAIAMAVLNPSMDDFRTHVEDTIGDRIAAETKSDALQRFGAGAIALLAEQVTVRKNYFLFSTYTIDLDGPDHTGNDWQFLGVAGTFLQLREPERGESGGRSTKS